MLCCCLTVGSHSTCQNVFGTSLNILEHHCHHWHIYACQILQTEGRNKSGNQWGCAKYLRTLFKFCMAFSGFWIDPIVHLLMSRWSANEAKPSSHKEMSKLAGGIVLVFKLYQHTNALIENQRTGLGVESLVIRHLCQTSSPSKICNRLAGANHKL